MSSSGLRSLVSSGPGMAVIASIGWSTIGLLNRLLEGCDQSAMIAMRSLEYSTFLLLVIWHMHSRHKSDNDHEPSMGKRQAAIVTLQNIFCNKDYRHWLCAFSLAANLVVSTKSYQSGETGLASVLGAGSMIIITICSPWALGEKVVPKEWLAVILGLSGLTVTAGAELLAQNPSVAAVQYGLACAVLNAAGLIFLKQRENHFHSKEEGGAATAGLESYCLSGFMLVAYYHQELIRAPLPTTNEMINIALLAIVSSAISDLLFMRGMAKPPRMSLVQLMIITRLNTILTPVWTSIKFRQFPTNYTLVGGLIVTVSLILGALWKPRQKGAVAAQEVVMGKDGNVIDVLCPVD